MKSLRLVVGNLNYSSWSMRPWLALTESGLPFKLFDVKMKEAPDYKDTILGFSGAGKVPILVEANLSIHESLAICEYVAELSPEKKLWPDDRHLRARGRAISCEMLSSFSALRGALPVNLRGRTRATNLSSAVLTDIARVEQIWNASLETSNGEYLLGDFSIADCMFFPVAARFRTYDIPVAKRSKDYMEALFSRPSVRALEEIASAAPPISEYDAALA
jgi:glutathione S-transferase